MVRYVIREAEGIKFRARVRTRLYIGLLLTEVSLGAWNVALLHTQWMNVPMAVIIGLLFLLFLGARADVRRAKWLKKRAEEL